MESYEVCISPEVVVHTCSYSIPKMEAGPSGVQDQPRLYNIMSQIEMEGRGRGKKERETERDRKREEGEREEG